MPFLFVVLQDMILAVLLEAIDTIELEHKDLEALCLKNPRGGFTDVGLNVEEQARNTTWPIFQAVVHTLLTDSAPSGLFTSTMAHLQLWLAEIMSATTSIAGATTERMNRIMLMLSSAVEVFVLANEEEAMAFEARCVAVRYELQRILQARAQEACDSQMMHPASASTLRKSDFNITDLKLNIPKDSVPNKGVTSIDELRKLASSNLLLLPAPLNPTSSFPSALSWIEHKLLVPPTLGLMWCSIGVTRPTGGRLLENADLAVALQSQLTFTKQEWAEFKIPDLRATDFVQSGSSYFKPVGLTRVKRMASQIVITTVEKIFFTRAGSLMKARNVSRDEILAMVSVLERYRLILSQYDIAEAQMKVEIQSRELLVVWAAFCLAHQTACSEHGLLNRFSVPLVASDLQHLVLSDRLAVDAVQSIASYLRANSTTGGPIFSTRPRDETFTFASQFAEQSREMIKIYEEDKKASSKRQEDRWNVVKEKQKRVQQLRTELQKMGKEELQLQLDIVKPSMYKRVKHFFTMTSISDLESKLAGKRSEIAQTLAEIANQEKPPPSILQPLPAMPQKAMAIIFFLKLPMLFEVLSTLSFMAQQMLLPPKNSLQLASVEGDGQLIELSLKQDEPETMWPNYYVEKDGVCSPGKTTITFASIHKIPEGQIGPDSVMKYSSSSDGVWYPDAILPGMWWSGGNFVLDRRGGYFSPFWNVASQTLLRVREHYFTEVLPAPASSLQWSMPMYKSETRCNVAVATQYAKPKWLSKPEYLSFGAIRSCPNQQDRKICVALRDRSLPFEEVLIFFFIGVERRAVQRFYTLMLNRNDSQHKKYRMQFGNSFSKRCFRSGNSQMEMILNSYGGQTENTVTSGQHLGSSFRIWLMICGQGGGIT